MAETSFQDALTDMTRVVQEQVMEALLKVDTESACETLYKYLCNPNELTLEEARGQLLYTEAARDLHRQNRSFPNKDTGLKYIECLKKLANYAAMLLKPQHMRPDNMWATIMKSNHIFEEYIQPFPAHNGVLEAMGYKLIGYTYSFRKGQASLEQTKELCSDLLVLRAYMEVKLKVQKVKPAELPVRSQVKRDEPLKTPDENSACEICCKPGMVYCEDKECVGKAWCQGCNMKWHVNNSKRSRHPTKLINNAKQLVEPVKPTPAPAVSTTPPTLHHRVSSPSSQPPAPALRREVSSPTARSNSSSAMPPRPVPAPRRRTSQLSSTTPASSETAQKADAIYQQEIRNLELLVNRMLPSEDISLFEQRISAIKQAMGDLRSKIADEPSNSMKKVRFNRELIALSKQRDRLEERHTELERAFKRNCMINSQVFDPSELYDEDAMEVDENVADMSDDIALNTALKMSQPSPFSYLKPVAEAEKAGYTMDEIVVGLKNTPFSDLMDWLTGIYLTIQSDVREAADNAPYMPKLTDLEIRNAFIAYALEHDINTGSLDVHPILAICQTNRYKTVKSFCEMFDFGNEIEEDGFFMPVSIITDDIVNECICKAKGDLVETRRLLNEKVEDKIREHIWDPVEPAELEIMGQEKRAVLKSALEVLTSKESRHTKILVAMAEFDLTYVAADELIYLMDNLYQKNTYMFESKDAVIAMSVDGIKSDRLHEHAVKYLSNKCSVCFDLFPIHEMANLCCHDTSETDMNCCKQCAYDQFVYSIDNEQVVQFLCPSRCGAPGEIYTDQKKAHEFFEGLLTVVFPNIGLSVEHINKFTTKLACWKLSLEPNFHWCPNGGCAADGYGFVDDRDQPKIACPRCGTSIKCRFCEKAWKPEHENKSCDEFATWERENSDEYINGVRQRDEFLDMYGIKCPACKSQFQLAKGGCMDCVCPTCNFKFCNGCGTKLFPKECPRNAELNCERLGMHGHHPRNCHAYLRDFSPAELKKLLQDNNVEFNSGALGHKCQEMLENDDNGKFMCNEDEVENGMCQRHYTEYLTAVVNKHKLEVLPLMSTNQLIMVLKRGGAECPDQTIASDEEYNEVLITEIKANIPLEDLSEYQLY